MGAGKGVGALGAQFAVYRAAWRVSCAACVVFGVVAAGLLLPAEILGLTVLVAFVAGLTAASMYSSGGGDGPISRRWTIWQVVIAVVSTSAAITFAVGLASALGWSVVWMAVLLTASSPRAVQWYGARLGLGTAIHRDAPQRSTADLCQDWRSSYEALRRATTDRQRLRIVMERQRCLDELGRRDPEGLEAWLSSAASAAGDPARFLKHQ